MKIKYYLRGLATGLVIAVVATSFAGSRRELSDDEIRARALELGMAMQGSTLSENHTETPKPSGEAMEETQESQETQVTQESQKTQGSQETEESQEAQESQESQENLASSIADEEEKSQESVETPGTEQSVDTVSITVYPGNGSNVVAQRLYEAGLVPDAKEYDLYLCRNGYDKCISVGTFFIPMGSTEEEIALIITNKKG